MQHEFVKMREALLASMRVIDVAQAGTGRTTRMMEDVREGHAIICTNREVGHLRHEVRRRGFKHVQVMVGDAYEFTQRRFQTFRGQHVTHFSHDFVHQVIEQEIMLMCERMSRHFDEHNREVKERENKRNADFAKEYMLQPMPILDDLAFTPVRKDERPSQISTPGEKL